MNKITICALVFFTVNTLWARNCNTGFYKKQLKYEVLEEVESQELKELHQKLSAKGISVEYIKLPDEDDIGLRIIPGTTSKFNNTLQKMDYFMEVPEVIFRLKEDSRAMGFYSPSMHYIFLSKGVIENLETTGQVTFFHELRHSMLNFRNYKAIENMDYTGMMRKISTETTGAEENLIWVTKGDEKIIHRGYGEYMSIEENITWRKDLTKNMEYINKALIDNDQAALTKFFERVDKKTQGAYLISQINEEVFAKVISENKIGNEEFKLIKRTVNGRERVEAAFEISFTHKEEVTKYNLILPIFSADSSARTFSKKMIADELNEQVANMYRLSVGNRQLSFRTKMVMAEVMGATDIEKRKFWMNLYRTSSPGSYVDKNSTLAKSFMKANGEALDKVNIEKEDEAFEHLFGLVADTDAVKIEFEGREVLRYADDNSEFIVLLETDGRFINFMKK